MIAENFELHICMGDVPLGCKFSIKCIFIIIGKGDREVYFYSDRVCTTSSTDFYKYKYKTNNKITNAKLPKIICIILFFNLSIYIKRHSVYLM